MGDVYAAIPNGVVPHDVPCKGALFHRITECDWDLCYGGYEPLAKSGERDTSMDTEHLGEREKTHTHTPTHTHSLTHTHTHTHTNIHTHTDHFVDDGCNGHGVEGLVSGLPNFQSQL